MRRLAQSREDEKFEEGLEEGLKLSLPQPTSRLTVCLQELFTRMASNRDFYRPTLTALNVIDEINKDLDSDEEDLNEGNESYEDEEGGDIFTNLMREAIDQSLDLDLYWYA